MAGVSWLPRISCPNLIVGSVTVCSFQIHRKIHCFPSTRLYTVHDKLVHLKMSISYWDECGNPENKPSHLITWKIPKTIPRRVSSLALPHIELFQLTIYKYIYIYVYYEELWYLYGGFVKWGYPKSSKSLDHSSITTHRDLGDLLSQSSPPHSQYNYYDLSFPWMDTYYHISRNAMISHCYHMLHNTIHIIYIYPMNIPWISHEYPMNPAFSRPHRVPFFRVTFPATVLRVLFGLQLPQEIFSFQTREQFLCLWSSPLGDGIWP